MLDPRTEVLFWTGIMRDHTMFLLNAFTAKDTQLIGQTNYFGNFFERKYMQIEKMPNWQALVPELLQGLNCFIEFKKMLLKSLINCSLQMNFTPGLVNHMLNEAMEFRCFLMTPSNPCVSTAPNPAGYIKLWLSDSIAHAAALTSFLDVAEAAIIEETNKYKMKFEKLMTRASELEMIYEKTGVNKNTLCLLVEQSVELMKEFICFLEKVKALRCQCKIMGMGTLLPLIPDHFIREHKHFILKITDCVTK